MIALHYCTPQAPPPLHTLSMLPTPRRFPRCLFMTATALLLSGLAVGQSDAPLHTGHAIPGIYGLESSARPARGLSFDNMTVIYTANTEKDRNGANSATTGSVAHISNHTTLTWLSPWRILGGNYVARATVAVANSAPNPRSLSAGNDGIGLGDIYLEPLSLYWPGEKGIVSFRLGMWTDTGSFSNTSEDNIGKGFGSVQTTLGWTHYISKDHLWHYSIITRYSTNSKVSGLDLRPGDDVVVDWNIGKQVNERWNLGLAGYGVFQTSKDKGADANVALGFYGTGGIGVIGRYALPGWKGAGYVRLFQEFNAYNRTEGQLAVIGVNFRL